MRALCWHGAGDVRVQDVPEPESINDRDAIVRVTSSAICGSDLHLFDGYMPTMFGHSPAGRIQRGEVDPTFVVTHRVSLEEAPDMYRIFRDREDDCVKVVLTP